MPRDPNDVTVNGPERVQRRLGELDDQKDLIRLRVGTGPAGAEGKEGPPGPTGPPGGEIPIRRGEVTVTYPGGAQDAAEVTVTHGLGTTPTAVVATVRNGGTAPIQATPYITAITSTTFKIACRHDWSTPAAGLTQKMTWIAC